MTDSVICCLLTRNVVTVMQADVCQLPQIDIDRSIAGIYRMNEPDCMHSCYLQLHIGNARYSAYGKFSAADTMARDAAVQRN
jgi:hypothetical protein